MIVISATREHPVMEDSVALKPSCPVDSNPISCSNGPPTLIVQQSSISSAGSNEKKGSSSSPLTPTSQRRAIFDNFWKKSSSIRDDDENTSAVDAPTKRGSSAKVEPSYLGIYSFAPPSPLTSPKPGLMSALSSPSDDSLTPSPTRPKSILRRHHSARGLRLVHPIEEETDGKPRSSSVCSFPSEIKTDSMLKLPFGPELPFAPQLFQDADTDSTSKESLSGMRSHSVHFDPTITIREVVGQAAEDDSRSNCWFNEDELQTFFREAIHLCHASAINSIKVCCY